MRVSTKLPVLVFVHGGGYMGGSSNSRLYAPDYLLNQDIVLVTFNYRLNILGKTKNYSENDIEHLSFNVSVNQSEMPLFLSLIVIT